MATFHLGVQCQGPANVHAASQAQHTLIRKYFSCYRIHYSVPLLVRPPSQFFFLFYFLITFESTHDLHSSHSMFDVTCLQVHNSFDFSTAHSEHIPVLLLVYLPFIFIKKCFYKQGEYFCFHFQNNFPMQYYNIKSNISLWADETAEA